MNLLDAFKQYLRDASPGGALNPEVTNQGILDAAALGTAPVPILGDAIGLAADVKRLKDNPSERTPLNFTLAGLGALPFVPSGLGVIKTTKIGDLPFDPRFDPRAKEQPRLRSLTTTIDDRPLQSAPQLDLRKYEGYPFITSMSDRTAAGGHLVGINGVDLKHKVDLRGGQDFMFDGNNGQVWASANGPVKQILGLAQDLRRVTGKDPLYMPWRMAPSGGDFANMTGEAMLSYAGSNMTKASQKKVDKSIKQFIPSWSGLQDAASIEQFRSAPDKTRKAIKNMLDVEYRNMGGLGLGEARLAVADQKQLLGSDGGLLNVGVIDSMSPMVKNSGHPAYPRGVPGQGLGTIDGDVNVFQMLPDVAANRGLKDLTAPRQTDLRALQMKPYGGLITEDVLRSLGY